MKDKLLDFILKGKHHLFRVKDLREIRENAERVGQKKGAVT